MHLTKGSHPRVLLLAGLASATILASLPERLQHFIPAALPEVASPDQFHIFEAGSSQNNTEPSTSDAPRSPLYVDELYSILTHTPKASQAQASSPRATGKTDKASAPLVETPAPTSPPLHPLGLWKRQGCKSGDSPCNNIGEPGYCCTTTAVCSRDQAGTVACCPVGAACFGTVGQTLTPTSQSEQVYTSYVQPTQSETFVIVTVEPSQTGFVQQGGTTVAVVGTGAAAALEIPFVIKAIIAIFDFLLCLF